MRIFKKYTGDKTYMFPNGRIATKEAVLEEFPSALMFTNIVETDEAEEVAFAIQNLSAMRGIYGVDPELDEDAAIAKIQEIANTPVDYGPSTEERTAAALEFLAMSSMPDVE